MEPKFTAIIEDEDLTKLQLNELIGSLITHEMINMNEVEKKRKRKILLSSLY